MQANTARSGGFTLIEAIVALAVLAVLVAVCVPVLSGWQQGRQAAAAAAFYKEGFQFARAQAVGHKSASRLVLSGNDNTGQLDWRVDICSPTPSVPCSESSGNWSTAGARSADGLLAANAMMLSVSPAGAGAVVFAPQGWVDGGSAVRIQRIDLAPALDRQSAFAPLAVVLSPAGTAIICHPGAAAGDAARCPP
jgi:type IV fimbrial biogenesis protein FimT